MTTLIRAVDVSSHQTPSFVSVNRWIAAGAQALIVHSYHSGEAAGLERSTREWIGVGRQAGIWTWPYVWLFRSFSASRAVRESIQVFRDAGENPRVIALDCESYGDPVSDPGPTAEQILSAVHQARTLGVEPILYSGAWWLKDIAGDHMILYGMPAWLANYDLAPSLNIPHPDWVTVVGHQYQGSPVDWSIFDLGALKALTAPPDPCAALRAGLAAELAKKRLSRPRLRALLEA